MLYSYRNRNGQSLDRQRIFIKAAGGDDRQGRNNFDRFRETPFDLKGLDPRTFDSDYLKGKIVLVEFWSVDCFFHRCCLM